MIKKIGIQKTSQNDVEFNVWAPKQNALKLKIFNDENEKLFSLTKDSDGYFKKIVSKDDVKEGDYYFYITDGQMSLPDPASYSQTQGVHGPSQVIFHEDFQWKSGASIENLVDPNEWIIYEIHPGTFSRGGDFASIAEKIPHFVEMGINALEIMPVSSFPGKRNWGYDGVAHFSVQESYGGPNEFKKLIDECHLSGISVILDVVYNHLGPEGNYLSQYGHYFTDKYKTPWGWAINFDDAYSNEVRNYFFQNALHWCENYRIDGLRLDAIHAIYDFSANHFLKELREFLDASGFSHVKLIAESDLNDPSIIRNREKGGYHLDYQWSDDFHHALHTLLAQEDLHYYKDFGRVDDLKKSLAQGFVYDGCYSEFRKRNHGGKLTRDEQNQLIISLQNHDQVGNRPLGDRLSSLLSKEKFLMGQALQLLSANIPMLFMGDEICCQKPFYYFTDHSDSNLINGVREGRRREFKEFYDKANFYPDPQDVKTFEDSVIDFNEQDIEFKEKMKELISMRKKYHSVLTKYDQDIFEELPFSEAFIWRRSLNEETLSLYVNFHEEKELKVNLAKNETPIVSLGQESQLRPYSVLATIQKK